MYERFIARQAILTQKMKLLGYELLFRSDEKTNATNDPNATSHVISASTMLFGWRRLVGPTLAFINFGKAELLNGAALLLPHEHTVIEITADVEITEEVVEVCASLQEAKYRIALDDFRDEPEQRELIPYADFLKVDFRKTTEQERMLIGRKYSEASAALIAKKVESWEDFQSAKEAKFRHFQGHFFLVPRVLERKDLRGSRTIALQLLQALGQSPLDIGRVETIMKRDAALTMKLLRYLNSPVMARQAEITSIGMAVALLGEEEFRRWAALVAAVSPAEGKPEELVKTALMRAFFCEELAKLGGGSPKTFEYFLVGLLSVMNAVLDQPMEEILSELAVSSRVKGALLGELGELKETLEAALAYERGDWQAFSKALEKQRVQEERVPNCYLSADQTVKALMMWESGAKQAQGDVQ